MEGLNIVVVGATVVVVGATVSEAPPQAEIHKDRQIKTGKFFTRQYACSGESCMAMLIYLVQGFPELTAP